VGDRTFEGASPRGHKSLLNSMVKDIINPILGLIVGDMDFSNVFFTLINFIIIGFATSGL
jgi:large-conductance mechanosensitive channel